MNKERTRILFFLLLGFLFPPVVWNFIMWFFQIVNSEELISLALVPTQGIFAIGYISFIILYANKNLKKIEEYEQGQENLEEIQKIISSFPKFYIVNIIIYCIIGPNSGMLMVDFLARTEYIYGLLLGVALILLFSLPFFNLVIYFFQRYVSEIPLSNNNKFLSLKVKLGINIIVTVIGVLSLFSLFNLVVFSLNLQLDYRELLFKNIFLILISLVISLINFTTLSKQIIKPITAVISQGQQGDFTKKLSFFVRDEIGELIATFNLIIGNFQGLISEINSIVENLSAYSEELSASAEEGNATIETTNDLIQSISSSIQQISASAEEVASFSQETTSQTNIGSQNIETTVNSIEEINQAVNETVGVINELDQNSKEIEQIVELITNIAEQTNLLALNAAIEAARAGSNTEGGQGFAVVAEEIRQLASETAEATDEIARLVIRTQKQSQAGIKKIREVAEKTKQGQEIVEKTGGVFAQIKSSIQETSIQIEQTASATNELAQDSDEIRSATDDVNNMSDEISNSAQELAEMAQKLQRLVKQFDV
ncbi:methyl-accepting chemotaxis protein [Natroniella sp. ANB-PHB2]|uniref:methyl-accepting chemotaxis protein n=1 Tax=Natroniella sp. ANB-PHB2 TaxID=3384444 RepID=UPI0038D4FC09